MRVYTYLSSPQPVPNSSEGRKVLKGGIINIRYDRQDFGNENVYFGRSVT